MIYVAQKKELPYNKINMILDVFENMFIFNFSLTNM